MTNKKNDKELNFEQGLGRLEELIGQLEDGEIGLEKSLEVFEEGIKLARRLNEKLDQAEKRLEILLKNEKGGLTGREFSLEPEEEDET
ncbi:MAG: exodeoxyribonuclease VII small subunit [Thermodesulfobacteriota bacterium]